MLSSAFDAIMTTRIFSRGGEEMAVIPVAIEAVCEILNLSDQEVKNNPLFTRHQKTVMAYLARYCLADVITAVKGDNSTEEQSDAFEMSYSFLMLESTIEFLNLNTVGKGIIKTTGMDDLSTELLTGPELAKFKKSLEIRALENIKSFLNDDGLRQLAVLKPRSDKSRFRAKIIGQ